MSILGTWALLELNTLPPYFIPRTLIKKFGLSFQIGLAVGDIAGVQRNARLKRLAMQVELHKDLEHTLPNSILKYGEKMDYTVWSSKDDGLIFKVSLMFIDVSSYVAVNSKYEGF